MSEVIRVVHLLAPGEVGGLETVVATLALGQAQAGMHVLVALLLQREDQGERWRATLEGEGVQVRPLVIRHRGYLMERKAVKLLLSSWRPHVMHTHGYRPDVLDAPVARKLGIPTVTTVHGFAGNDGKNRFYEWLQRKAFQRFDKVIAVSSRLATELHEAGVPAARIHLVRNAWTPPSPFLTREVARSKLGLEAEETVVAWIGRFTPEKAPDLMLRAFSRLRHPSAVLAMIGEGWMGDSLREAASDLGIGARVVWLGIIPEAYRFLRAFDALALSSRTEGTPMILLEAMAAGVPIIARAVGGVPEMLSNGESVLVRTGEDGEMADAIRTVLRDREGARAMAARAHLRFEQEFSVSAWVEQHEGIYRALQK